MSLMEFCFPAGTGNPSHEVISFPYDPKPPLMLTQCEWLQPANNGPSDAKDAIGNKPPKADIMDILD